MPATATPRFTLVKAIPGDPVQQLRLSIANIADQLELLGAQDAQGNLASRPTSSPGTPGVRGRYYFVTGDSDSTQNNRLYRDAGTAWVEITVSVAVDGAAGTGTLRTLGTGAQQAAAGNDARLADQRVPTDGSVTSAKIADPLKPSAGAGAGTESLRALGPNAGQAAPGTDSRFAKIVPPTFAFPPDFVPPTTLGLVARTFAPDFPTGFTGTLKLLSVRAITVSGTWPWKLRRSVADGTVTDLAGFSGTASSTSSLVDPVDITLNSGDRIELWAAGGGSSPVGPTVAMSWGYDT